MDERTVALVVVVAETPVEDGVGAGVVVGVGVFTTPLPVEETGEEREEDERTTSATADEEEGGGTPTNTAVAHVAPV